MSTSSTGFMPAPLADAIKGELSTVRRDRGYLVTVEYWVQKGVPVEARVRTRESLHIVCLSS